RGDEARRRHHRRAEARGRVGLQAAAPVSDLPELRVSDADRDRVALALRDACAEGRLTLDELAARVGHAYAAKTAGELEALTRDLPAAPVERKRRRRTKWLSGVLFGYIVRKGRWRVPRFGLVLVGFG